MLERIFDDNEVIETGPSTVDSCRPFLVLDAFAGAGGFSLGFEQAGYKIVGAIESDAWACETFSTNHPHAKVFQRDIRQLNNEELLDGLGDGRPTILVGGPPCQGYSVCNKDSGDPRDPRNSLFREFLQIVKLYEPQVVLMENVPNIIKARTEAKNRLSK